MVYTIVFKSSTFFFLRAQPDGSCACDALVQSDWEQFLLVSETDIAVLKHVLGNNWVLKSSGALIMSESISVGEGFGLRFGDERFDLRLHVPLTGLDGHSAAPLQLRLLRDGWKIDEARLYRPLVYTAAFKKREVILQMFLALRSLVTFGGYRGEVHVLTDISAAEILEEVPGLEESRLSVRHLTPMDFTGFVASKYLILEHEAAYWAQPLLFIDADIVFDAPLDPILTKITLLDKIAAPIETFSAMSTAPSSGATLLQRDLCDPRFSCGFNAGTLGIPNLHRHGATLGLILRIIINHAALYNRTEFTWVDQEVANYTSYKIGHFDTHTLSPYVQEGLWQTADDRPLPRGIVHFWPPRDAKAKLEAMERYMAALSVDTK
jgi:hypothetical protein